MISSASACDRIDHIEFQPALIDAWLARNKIVFSADHEMSNKISDCPRPWG